MLKSWEMKVSPIPVKNGLRVHLLSPVGRYPADTFVCDSAALVVNPEICFSIVRVKKTDWSFSEVDILKADEVPLFGSILMSGEAGTPYLFPYPTDHSVLLESFQGIDNKSILECKSFLIDTFKRERGEENQAASFHKPPMFGGIEYSFVKEKNVYDERLALLRRLETAKPVILRGVSCLLKGRMAFEHSEFREAGCIYLWIALDAAYSLILEKLRNSGIANPTSADAARYFDKISGFNTEWEKFFEEDYENRIRAIHPYNRIQDPEAVPQFLADDFLELNDILIPLFDFLAFDTASVSDHHA